MGNASSLVRPEVLALPPYNAGLTAAEVMKHHAPARISKLGSNESPLGPSPRALVAAVAAIGDARLYPDPASSRLRDAIGARFGVPAGRVMAGNGSEELLSIIARAVLRPGDRVVTLYPSFPLHEDYATLMGASVERVAVRPDLTIDVGALAAAAARPCRMIIFSNPMNPVGSWLDGGELARVQEAAGPDALLVVDEAYAEYAMGEGYPSAAGLLAGSDNPWAVLRTFSKGYGLAGLRVGYGIFGDAALVGLLDKVRTPFNVNAVAQEAAVAALDDDGHLADVVGLAAAERARVERFLRGAGARAAASKGNFLFFECGGDSTTFAEALLRQGAIVKPWKQQGIEEFARVSLGSVVENDHFIAAVSPLIRPSSAGARRLV